MRLRPSWTRWRRPAAREGPRAGRPGLGRPVAARAARRPRPPALRNAHLRGPVAWAVAWWDVRSGAPTARRGALAADGDVRARSRACVRVLVSPGWWQRCRGWCSGRLVAGAPRGCPTDVFCPSTLSQDAAHTGACGVAGHPNCEDCMLQLTGHAACSHRLAAPVHGEAPRGPRVLASAGRACARIRELWHGPCQLSGALDSWTPAVIGLEQLSDEHCSLSSKMILHKVAIQVPCEIRPTRDPRKRAKCVQR